MLTDRVETMKAYRDTLRRRFDQMTHAALEPVPGGEWDGMQVVRRKELERVIHDFAEADPDPLPTAAEVRTPARVFVDAVCPICSIAARVLVEIHAELVVDDDGRTIKAKASAKGSSHVCGQLPLEPGDDADQMRLSELVGPTEPALILATNVPRPDDVDLARPADDRCGATATVPGDDGDDELVCERAVDHDAGDPDQVRAEGRRDHWSEGGFAWHFEERPVDLGIGDDVNAAPADQANEEDDDGEALG